MKTRLLTQQVGVLLVTALLGGCSLARDLTTQHRTYTYSISVPPVPANTMGQGQVSVDEQVQNAYSKYHGGVDSTRLAYQAQNSSAIQPATMKLYVSLAGSVPENQLDQQATLIETINLAPSQNQTVSLSAAPNNDALRSFLASALSQHNASTLYFYAVTSSTDPTATVTLQTLTAQVQVHGSYF